MSQTTLYRLFDSTDRLIYVGISARAGHRLGEHSRRATWWPRVARATFRHFDRRADAAFAEQVAIRAERPLANQSGTGRRPPRKLVGFPGLIHVLLADATVREVAFRVCTPDTIELFQMHGVSA